MNGYRTALNDIIIFNNKSGNSDWKPLEYDIIKYLGEFPA
jgi:hypothetical protein